MSRAKIRDFVDEYKDTYGKTPSHAEISSTLGIKPVDAKSYIMESASVSNESAFDNIHGNKPDAISGVNIIQSLPGELRPLGHDIYVNELKEKDILKKHKIGRTTYFSKKRKIDSFIGEHSATVNTEYN
jgi:DNA-directed RNA polymerase specialized sigma subunit